MSEQELREFKAAMEKLRLENTSSREKATQFLKEEGFLDENGEDAAKLPAFQTVRAVFVEGGRIYEEAGFFEKTHIHIYVREESCIKRVFRVSDDYLTA